MRKNKHYLHRCAHCHYLSTDHESLDGKTNYSMGDVSFCINCGELNLFTEDGFIRTQIEDLEEKTKQEIKIIEKAWLQTRSLSKRNVHR